MDPLSVTSGIVGIVAFALQLAKTASKVKQAVEELKSAPQDARDLIERLVMLETSCQLVGFHLERRQSLPDHSLAALDIISQALAQCLPRVQRLEKMLSELTSSNALAGTPRSKLDTVSRLRLVLRKGKISSLVLEIDRVMSLLQFVIQVDMWTITSVPLQSTSICNSGIQSVDRAPKTERTSGRTLVDSALSQSNVASKIRPTNRQCRTYRYLGYVTWTTTDRKIGDETDNANYMTHRKGCITFRLPFTSTRLIMKYHGGMGTPSYALNVTHVIEKDSELWYHIWALMRFGGDPKELHELVSRRELSLYSMYPYDDQEFNLFFVAVAMRWAEGCRYLLQHDFRHKFEEDETPECRFSMVHPLSGKVCEVTEIMLSARPYDMRGEDIKYLLDTATDPEYFSKYLKGFLEYALTDEAKKLILSFAWKRLLLNISTILRPCGDIHSWITIIRYLIEHGVDMHQPIYASDDSAYICLLYGAVHPFQADERAYYWLKALEMCGVDLSSYIEAETALIEQFGINPYPKTNKKRIMLDFEGLSMPSWRWELPTESKIIEVLDEFQNFGSDQLENQLHAVCPASEDDFMCWTPRDNYTDLVQYCFPFLLSSMNCILRPDDNRLAGRWCRRTYNCAAELRGRRFARQQANKWRKSHPGEKPPWENMPGTWVD